jgi:hypothetical protein
MPLYLQLSLLLLPHPKKYEVTGVVKFLVTRDKDRDLQKLMTKVTVPDTLH